MRINKSDIKERVYTDDYFQHDLYIWICPECLQENTDLLDPYYAGYYYCEHCKIDIELQEE